MVSFFNTLFPRFWFLVFILSELYLNIQGPGSTLVCIQFPWKLMGVVNTYRGETIPSASKTTLEQFKMPWSDREQV